MRDAPPTDSGDLWRWVDRLTRDRKQRLVRSTPGAERRTIEHVDVPSLWTQLREGVGSTNSSDGGPSKSTGSRAPLDLGISSLMDEITRDVVGALRRLGSPARVTTGEYGTLVDTPAELRHLAAVVVALDQQTVDTWTRTYRRWVSQAETALVLDDSESVTTRGIRGHACPTCGSDSVAREQDGETYRDPALVISFRDGQVLHATCRACAAGWWRGDGLDELSVALAYPTVLAAERMGA